MGHVRIVYRRDATSALAMNVFLLSSLRVIKSRAFVNDMPFTKVLFNFEIR